MEAWARGAGFWCSAQQMLMFIELVTFPCCALLKDLFWTGLLFLLDRYLHQSGALTVEALQDPAPDPVEGMEEDIADKVGPGPPADGTARPEDMRRCCRLGMQARLGWGVPASSEAPVTVQWKERFPLCMERPVVSRICLWAHLAAPTCRDSVPLTPGGRIWGCSRFQGGDHRARQRVESEFPESPCGGFLGAGQPCCGSDPKFLKGQLSQK